MFKLLLSLWYGLPLSMKNIWYNRSVYCKDIKYPEVFDKNGTYIPCHFGNKVVMNHLKSGYKVYYTITRMTYKNGDWLSQSDGYNCDLTLSHISKK